MKVDVGTRGFAVTMRINSPEKPDDMLLPVEARAVAIRLLQASEEADKRIVMARIEQLAKEEEEPRQEDLSEHA